MKEKNSTEAIREYLIEYKEEAENILNKKTKSKTDIYNEYMSTRASFEKFKIYFASVAYCYLNGLKYFDWDFTPTCHDMLRLCRTYESMTNKLNRLFKEWCKICQA